MDEETGAKKGKMSCEDHTEGKWQPCKLNLQWNSAVTLKEWQADSAVPETGENPFTTNLCGIKK